MKKLMVLSIGIIFIVCVFMGCGKDKSAKSDTGKSTETNESSKKDVKSGKTVFGSMKSGAWAEYTSPDGGIQRMKYFEDSWEGKECYIIETESQGSKMLATNQMWMDKATGKGVLYLTKIGGKVMRIDINQTPTTPDTTEDADLKTKIPQISPQSVKIGEDKYTTPTGKTVKVVKYKVETPTGSVENWVSDEVPFKNVQIIGNSALKLTLRDFSNSGAERAITKQEAENAQPFGMPGGMPGMPPIKGMPGSTR
jgi:hypothetical protein